MSLFSSTLKREISVEIPSHYFIECGLTSSLVFEGNNDKNIRIGNGVNCIYDPGADISFLFLLNCWNFKAKNFIQSETDHVINSWRDHVAFT